MTQEQIKKELVQSKMIIKTHLKQIDDQMKDIRELKQSNKELSEMHDMAMRRVFELKDKLKVYESLIHKKANEERNKNG